MKQTPQAKQDVLQIFGEGLPPAGAIFLAPLNARDAFSAKIVRCAFAAAAQHWPRPGKQSPCTDRYSLGELANGEPEKVLAYRAFEGARFVWTGEGFEKMGEGK